MRWLVLARESGASLFMVVQGGLAALLTRHGAGSDIAIGSPIAGRTEAALDDLVGFFVNTLVLRTDTSGDPSFRQLLARVRSGNLAAYSHQDLPFERLVEVLNPARSLARHPLFQVMLAMQSAAPAGVELAGVATTAEAVALGSAKFDLSLSLLEHRTAQGAAAGIAGALEYATDLFDRSGMEALAGRLERLLRAAVAEPDRSIGSLEILSAVERRTILQDWNATARALSRRHAGRSVCRAGCALSAGGRGCARGFAAELPRARRALEPAGASPSRACRLVPRWWSGCASSARRR